MGTEEDCVGRKGGGTQPTRHKCPTEPEALEECGLSAGPGKWMKGPETCKYNYGNLALGKSSIQ